MLDPAKQAKLDQDIKALAELVPPTVKSLYDGFLKEFDGDEAKAWALTKIACFALTTGKGVT